MSVAAKKAVRGGIYEFMAPLHVGDLFGHAVKPPRKPKKKVRNKNKRTGPPPSQMPRPERFTPINCPCCSRQIDAPALDIVIDHYRVPPAEAAILRAVWKGKGLAVQTSRIFDAMYADDPDGGPEQAEMYAAFKANLHNLRRRLAGSGVHVENIGYRQGYRLVLGKS